MFSSMTTKSIVNHMFIQNIEIGGLYKSKYGGLALVVDKDIYRVYYECFNNPNENPGKVSMLFNVFAEFYKQES